MDPYDQGIEVSRQTRRSDPEQYVAPGLLFKFFVDEYPLDSGTYIVRLVVPGKGWVAIDTTDDLSAAHASAQAALDMYMGNGSLLASVTDIDGDVHDMSSPYQ